MLEGAIDLLPETARRRLMLWWLLVELCHLIVKFLNLSFIAYFVCSIFSRYKAFWAGVVFFCGDCRTVFELFNLSLDFGDLLFKLFVPKKFIA